MVGGECHALAALPPRKRLGTKYTGGGWVLRLVWKGVESLAHTGV